MSITTEIDKMNNIQYYELMKPVYQTAFPEDWKANLAMICAQREIDKQRAAREVNRAVRELSELGEIRTCLLTLNLDQKEQKRDCTEKAKEIVDFILGRNLSYLNDPIISIEFFTPKWNPHIHIFSYLDSGQKPGALAQRIRRLISKRFPIVYNVNGTIGTAATQAEYLVDLKKESKRENQEMDRAYREENNISPYYK